jgi:predicted TIM-barrel fold metal-dependent hydrolase
MAETQRYRRIISADSHVLEPLDLWWNALGHKYGDRTPRKLDEFEGQKGSFFYTGYRGGPVMDLKLLESSPETGSSAEMEALVEAKGQGFADAGFDPAVRVKFQEEAGVTAEAMNSTFPMVLMRNPDIEVMQASLEVFNDWESEFCSYNPKRLIGISMISMHDVEWATKELERTLKKGMVGPMINCVSPEGSPPYWDSTYDKFWAMAEEAGAPITLHLLTGRALDPLVFAQEQTPLAFGENPRMWVELFNEVQGTLASDFIYGGILDRFPKLKVVCSEFEMSWVPGFMARLDQIDEVAPSMHIPKMKLKGSDYMRTRVWHGFIDDTLAARSIHLVGASQVLWGSDFPHIRAIGLEAQSAVYKLIETLPEDEQQMIVGGNAAKVFDVAG